MYREPQLCPKDLQARNRELEAEVRLLRHQTELAEAKVDGQRHVLDSQRERVRELMREVAVLEGQATKPQEPRVDVVYRDRDLTARGWAYAMTFGVATGLFFGGAMPGSVAMCSAAVVFVVVALTAVSFGTTS